MDIGVSIGTVKAFPELAFGLMARSDGSFTLKIIVLSRIIEGYSCMQMAAAKNLADFVVVGYRLGAAYMRRNGMLGG